MNIVFENQDALRTAGERGAETTHVRFENSLLAVGGVLFDENKLNPVQEPDSLEFLSRPLATIRPLLQGNAVDLIEFAPEFSQRFFEPRDGLVTQRCDQPSHALSTRSDRGNFSKYNVGEFRYKLGSRLAQIRFIRKAIDARADLSPFRKRPTMRILGGVFLIAFSFVMCWPAIGLLGAISVELKKPLLVGIGGPVLYFSSHLCYLAGMALSGAEYSWIFLRWTARVGVEALLRCGPTPDGPEL